MVETHGIGLLDMRMERLVEILHFITPGKFPFGDLIEFLFHACGEVIVEDSREILGKEVVDHHTGVSRHKTAAVRASVFTESFSLYLAGGECETSEIARSAVTATMHDVSPGLDGRYCRSVCGRAAYAEVLHLLHKRGLCIARRRLGESFGSGDGIATQFHSRSHGRKQSAPFAVLFLFIPHGIRLHKAIELYGLSLGMEFLGSSLITTGVLRFRSSGYAFDVDSGLLKQRITHLRSDGAAPYQAVELFLAVGTLYIAVADVGGTYGLMSLLGAFGAGVVAACTRVFLAVVVYDSTGYLGEGCLGEIGGVGTHVCDLSRLVKLLRHAHGGVDREAEPFAGLLLES